MTGDETLTAGEILNVLDRDGEWYKSFVERWGFIPSVNMALHTYLKERDGTSKQFTKHTKTVRQLIEGRQT